MKKNTLTLIIAIAGLYFSWKTYKMYKQGLSQNNTQSGASGSNGVNSSTDEEPNDLDPDEVIKKTRTDDCPYCGAHNARINQWVKPDGQVVRTQIICPNKSCPTNAMLYENESGVFDIEQ